MDCAVFEYRQREEIFLFSKKVQTDCGAHSAFCATGITVFLGGREW
jgi:hypothetical protein